MLSWVFVTVVDPSVIVVIIIISVIVVVGVVAVVVVVVSASGVRRSSGASIVDGPASAGDAAAHGSHPRQWLPRRATGDGEVQEPKLSHLKPVVTGCMW